MNVSMHRVSASILIVISLCLFTGCGLSTVTPTVATAASRPDAVKCDRSCWFFEQWYA